MYGNRGCLHHADGRRAPLRGEALDLVPARVQGLEADTAVAAGAVHGAVLPRRGDGVRRGPPSVRALPLRGLPEASWRCGRSFIRATRPGPMRSTRDCTPSGSMRTRGAATPRDGDGDAPRRGVRRRPRRRPPRARRAVAPVDACRVCRREATAARYCGRPDAAVARRRAGERLGGRRAAPASVGGKPGGRLKPGAACDWSRPGGEAEAPPRGTLSRASGFGSPSAATTASRFARQTSSGIGGRMSSQIAAKLPISCGRRAGRAMNHQWRCSPPSPQRQTWTRPISPIDRIARSIRAIRIPSSAASSSGQVAGLAEVEARLEQQHDGQAGRLGETSGGASARSTQRNSLSGASQRQHSMPPTPRRGSSCSTGGSSARGLSSPSKGNVSHVSTAGIRSAPAARA